MFSFSLSGTGFDGFDGFGIVGFGLGQVDFGLLKDVFVIGDAGFQSGDGVFVVSDFVNQSSDGFVTDGLVSSVFFVSSGLVIINFVNDFLDQ